MNFLKDVTPSPNPGGNWDADMDGTGNADSWAGWLDKHSQNFNASVEDLKKKLQDAFVDLSANPSDPAKLAAYQTALSEYNMYRMLQSNSSKTLADMQKQNIRNIA